MNISKLYFKETEPIDFLLKCKEQNSVLIKQVLKNNSYLLRKYGIRHNRQIKELREKGVKISASGISKYKKGIYKTCALTYLQIFAEYWFIPLWEMMMSDFELADYYNSGK